ncbi:amino acid ABC transporter permease [Allisonella histaminiformans]|uniref:Polar amino acid transport system permease protein n=1 Tax=Allisonella histaminiformans TaxID=209880 RepID=A0A1G5V935_9FIRM|nr:amino acid ABC transporter permease [Allisonella histaminiformans]PWL47546.1 MAG: amino acid ABC transporter permease [Veillonellaceae bacterium]MCI6003650.1 amino acid ABC transporter permease [Allisonella histaminiformans]MDD6870685.1 amino acid ABC transporter permease [Allisonella histaminiformans]MDY3957371.1 amino acid ABC transporter permease [Allisonella histaminiformans]MDY4540942.1 amino acid ABC transporter permease [Allisonella histaminiformans]
MDFELIEQSLPYLIQGALITIEITLMAVGIGFFIGLFAGIARICRIKALRIIATIYADCIRGTPLLVQIFLIYFALPMLIHTQINPFVAAVTACAINSGAYVSEIFRAGIQAIDQGQFEAGRSLGLSWWQTMYYIILPQAFHNILPPLGNEFITMLKDSSLVSVIGFEELTRRGQLIIAQTYASFEIWMTVAALYLIMTLAIAKFVSFMEHK